MLAKLTPRAFCESFSGNEAAYDASRVEHIGGGFWQARCPAGVLAKPDGDTRFSEVTELLSVLAGVGIRRCEIEWDGLPATRLDAAK